MRFSRSAFGIALLLACASLLTACEHLGDVSKIGTTVATATGHISADEAASMNRVAEQTEKTAQDFTARQEHFLGRAVVAQILSQYPPYENEEVNRYLNELGQTLAAFSDRPETYGGYRFLALDEDTPNAFAAPGGFILVTRGLLERVENEAALAGVLAHEINHVSEGHGLDAIRQERVNQALIILATESARQYGSNDLRQLTDAFGGAVGDVTNKLINSGYSRDFERDADAGAVALLQRTGYGLDEYLALLEQMDHGDDGSPGFFNSHPHVGDRIEIVENALDESRSPTSGARLARFQSHITEPLGR